MVSEERYTLPLRRKWFAIAMATVATLISYSFILFAFVAGSTEGGPNPGPPLALGLSLVPFVFLTAAFLTRHPRAGGAVLKAMGLWAVIGIPLAAMDIVTGLVAGFGAGAVVAVRSEEEHTRKSRIIAVTAATLYTLILVQFAPETALVGGSVLPFVGVGIADSVMERKARLALSD
jgi:hypothetical protein